MPWGADRGGVQQTKFVPIRLAGLIAMRSRKAGTQGSVAEAFSLVVMDCLTDATERERRTIRGERERAEGLTAAMRSVEGEIERTRGRMEALTQRREAIAREMAFQPT